MDSKQRINGTTLASPTACSVDEPLAISEMGEAVCGGPAMLQLVVHLFVDHVWMTFSVDLVLQ